MTVNEQKEILEKASEEMCKSLNSFGTNETLKLLVTFSSDDVIVNELLARFPSIVAIGDFFCKKPVYEIDKKNISEFSGC